MRITGVVLEMLLYMTEMKSSKRKLNILQDVNQIRLKIKYYSSLTGCKTLQKEYDGMVDSLENEGLHIYDNIPSFSSVKTGLFNAGNRV